MINIIQLCSRVLNPNPQPPIQRNCETSSIKRRALRQATPVYYRMQRARGAASRGRQARRCVHETSSIKRRALRQATPVYHCMQRARGAASRGRQALRRCVHMCSCACYLTVHSCSCVFTNAHACSHACVNIIHLWSNMFIHGHVTIDTAD